MRTTLFACLRPNRAIVRAKLGNLLIQVFDAELYNVALQLVLGCGSVEATGLVGENHGWIKGEAAADPGAGGLDAEAISRLSPSGRRSCWECGAAVTEGDGLEMEIGCSLSGTSAVRVIVRAGGLNKLPETIKYEHWR